MKSILPQKYLLKIQSKPSFQKDIINKSKSYLKNYFSEDWYVSQYGTEIDDGVRPFRHYLNEGWKRGFYPNPFFSPNWYLAEHADAANSGLEPLSYWYIWGRSDNHTPSPMFDPAGYLQRYEDIGKAAMDPFLHYVRHGVHEGREPGMEIEEAWRRGTMAANFDPSHAIRQFPTPIDYIDVEWYRSRYRSQLSATADPYQDYMTLGWRVGRQPNPFFSPGWYLKRHPEAAALEIDPLVHWAVAGRTAGIKPSPAFDPAGYLAKQKDIARAGIEPFKHFIRNGCREGREPGFPLSEIPARRAANPEFDWQEATSMLNGPESERSTPLRRNMLRALTPEDCHPLKASTRDPVTVGFLKDKAQPARLLSLDVWDTVLRRDCDPDEIKLRGARALWLLAAREGVALDHISPVDLMEFRRRAEAAVGNKEHEYRAPEVFEQWLLCAGIRDGELASVLRDRLIASERDAEIGSTRLDETIFEFLRDSADKELIAISDFYFGCDFIREILDAKGIADTFSQVFVSCDHMQTKRGGELFSVVQDKVASANGKWLHVGDNIQADYKSPVKLGIDAFHYRNSAEETAKDWYRQAYDQALLGDMSVHAARIRAELAACADTTAGDDPLKTFGINLAPVGTAYALFALEQGVRRNIERMFFFTREGVFVRRLYDRLVELDVYDIGAYPPATTLAVSRRATFAASLRGIGMTELLRMWGQYSRQSVSSFARSLNLDMDMLCDAARKLGLDPTQEIEHPWEDPTVRKLLADDAICRHVAETISMQRAVLRDYLGANGFDTAGEARYGIVDIGWRGTIQDNLSYLTSARVHGVYFGLDEFINDQPANATKAAFLFDRNKDRTAGLRDYAPIEFLFNATGGSVIGYRDGQPLTHIVPGEESVIETAVRSLQDGMAQGHDIVARYVRRHGLTSADLHALAEDLVTDLIAHPPAPVAEAFMALEHNETFGAGEVQHMEAADLDITEATEMPSAEVNRMLTGKLAEVRWPTAFLGLERTQLKLEKLPLEQRLAFPRGTLFPAPSLVRHLGTDGIAFFCPSPIRGSGGHRTIYNIARGLHDAGFACRLSFDAEGDGLEIAEEIIGTSAIPLSGRWDASIKCAAAVATVHYSSRYVRDHFSDRCANTYYLVQDFEAAFNPVGDAFVEGENSFVMGHTHITIGNWLTHMLGKTYGARAVPTGLGVDSAVYRTLEQPEKEPAVAFLFQPEKPRRMTRLAIEALRLLKSRRPDIRILLYGSNRRVDLPFQAENLGVIGDLSSLNALYNRCTAGLCVSLTNPSRIPFEMMAAGCVPIDVYRYNNMFDYPDGTAKLAYQAPASLAEALLSLFDDPEDADRRRRSGVQYMAPRSLRWEVDVAVNAVATSMAGGDLSGLPFPRQLYSDAPVIAGTDDNPAVRAFCASQLRQCSAWEI